MLAMAMADQTNSLLYYRLPLSCHVSQSLCILVPYLCDGDCTLPPRDVVRLSPLEIVRCSDIMVMGAIGNLDRFSYPKQFTDVN